MKAAEVLNLLRISRPTLTNYVKQGYLKVAMLPNGRYDYNDKSVYRFMNKDIPRKNVIYARVSTRKQKKDLENQIQLLKHLCFQNGILINGIYEDIASGMNLDRKNLLPLIKEIINYKINSVIISHKDRLSRIGFKLFQHLFREFGTELVVINELESGSTEQEIFQEIISLLHCYAMSMYSRRRKDFVKKKKRPFQDEISVQI
jgi:predicted site-specific integrase-resolvase